MTTPSCPTEDEFEAVEMKRAVARTLHERLSDVGATDPTQESPSAAALR